MKSNQANQNNREYKKLLGDLEFCDMALQISPEDDNAYYNKAEILLQLSKYEDAYLTEALECYNIALRFNSENLLALCDRAKLHAKIGNGTLAINDLIKVKELVQDRGNDAIKLYAQNILKDLDVAKEINQKIESAIQHLAQDQRNQIVPAVNIFDDAVLSSVEQIIAEKIATQLKVDDLIRLKDNKNQEEIINLKKDLASRDQELSEIKALQSKILASIEQNTIDIDKVKSDTETLITKFDAIERTLESFNSKIEDGAQQLSVLVDDFINEKSNIANIKTMLQDFIVKSAKDANLAKNQIVEIQQQFDTRMDHILPGFSSTEMPNAQHIQAIVNSLTQEIKNITKTVCKHDQKLKEHDLAIQDIQTQLIDCATKEEFTKLEKSLKSTEKILTGKINLIEGELDGQQVQISHIDEALFNTLIYKEADIRKGFENLQDNKHVYEYATTFYWTLSNYLMTYRILSTGIVQNKVEESTLEKITSTATKIIGSSVKGMPVLSGVVEGIESTLSEIYQGYKQMHLDQKIKKVNEVIAFNCILEQDLTLAVAKSAIEIANIKKDKINNKAVDKLEEVDSAHKWLDATLSEGLSKFIGAKTTYSTKVSKMALEDVVLLIGTIVKADEKLVIDKSSTNALDQKIINIATSDLIEQQLKLAYQDHSKSSNTCTIFQVDKIVYENEILNHPELIKKIAESNTNFDIVKILDLSTKLDKDFLADAIKDHYSDHDISLMLAGLISVEMEIECCKYGML